MTLISSQHFLFKINFTFGVFCISRTIVLYSLNQEILLFLMKISIIMKTKLKKEYMIITMTLITKIVMNILDENISLYEFVHKIVNKQVLIIQ